VSTQYALIQGRARNIETQICATGCLIVIGFIGGLNLLDDNSSYDVWLISAVVAGVLMTVLWYVACSLLFGITLHWHAKERVFRSQSKSSDN